MNAIQYFEWGGEGKKIHYCRIRVKNFFNTQEGRNMENFLPFRVSNSSYISYIPIHEENVKWQVRRSKVFREGNDFVWDVFIKENINDTRTPNVIDFYISFGHVEYFNEAFFKTGNAYINGRKIKTSHSYSAFVNRKVDIYLTLPSWSGAVRYEDNDEPITLPSLINKEIVLELN